MSHPSKNRRDAMLRGAATLFDLSGTAFLPEVRLGSLDDGLKEIRKGYEAIGEGFRAVLRSELDVLRKESDAERR